MGDQHHAPAAVPSRAGLHGEENIATTGIRSPNHPVRCG